MPNAARKVMEMDSKIIRVSKKRQITIPLEYYNQLNLGDEVECFLKNNALVIRPLVRNAGEFSVEILKDLVSRGLSGDELVREFEEQSQYLVSAVANMLDEADKIAKGDLPAAEFEDIFDSED